MANEISWFRERPRASIVTDFTYTTLASPDITFTLSASATTGDLLIAMVRNIGGSGAFNTLTGWTERGDSNGMSIQTKIVDGTDTPGTTTYTFTGTVGVTTGRFIVVRGGSYDSIGALNRAAHPLSVSAVTVAQDYSLAIAIISGLGGTVTASNGFELTGGSTSDNIFTKAVNAGSQDIASVTNSSGGTSNSVLISISSDP